MFSKPIKNTLTKLSIVLSGGIILTSIIFINYNKLEKYESNLQHVVKNQELQQKLDIKAENFSVKMDENPLENTESIQDSLLSHLSFESESRTLDQMNSFMENLPSFSDLCQWWQNWNLFLKTLTFEELGALAHLLSSFFVLLCIINIITVIYGDYMIRYLKLETRFPKIAKIIQLRRQLQLYSMLLYFIPAILTLLTVMYVNAYILFG